LYSDLTVPFYSPVQRKKHFLKHGHVFGAADEFDYERMADIFMLSFLHLNMFECVNPTGTRDRIRLDGITRHFGVDFSMGIRTYHIRDASGIARRGGPLGFVTHKCSEVH
jgi:hypothetical protein